MGLAVCGGALMQCTMGSIPMPLVVLPKNKVNTLMPLATVQDHIPVLNIPPFGMCKSIVNPTVLAATVAALGVLTPMPCLPVTTAPWSPGSKTVKIAGQPALNHSSKCNCLWAGSIEFKFPGQVTILIP